MEDQKHIRTLIIRGAFNDLSIDEKQQLDQWLHASDKNKKYYQKLINTWKDNKAIQDWESIDLDKNWLAIQKKSGKRQSIRLMPVLRWAAVLLVLVASSFLLFNQRASTSISNSNVQAMNYTLPDGTSVWLKQNAEIEFKLRNFKNNRNVSSSGEVYFEVVKSSTPFTVSINQAQIQVLGTSFNISENSEGLEVMLIEGKVKFTANNSEAILNPGDKATFNGLVIQISEIQDMNKIGWKTGRFEFENQKLTEVLDRVSSYYGISYELDTDLESVLISTQLYELPLNKFIEELEFITETKIELSDKHLKISNN